jgi:hypothetical protein
MIGKRTRYSLAQFLEIYDPSIAVTLLGKYDLHASISHGSEIYDLLNSIRDENDERVLNVLGEIVRTKGHLRSKVNPKYVFDERFNDLTSCLQLDGYILEEKSIIQSDPSIGDGEPVEDDLVQALESSGLVEADKIIRKISDSSIAYRGTPPNYNACLNDIRVALETLAQSIALTLESSSSPGYDRTKWGAVINFLRSIDYITLEEERGLVGVYGFISPGSHRPLGVPEEQMARLGRSLALSMCWFLIKLYPQNA